MIFRWNLVDRIGQPSPFGPFGAKICSDIFPWTLSAHDFPRATLSKSCSLLGTDNVCGQISKHIVRKIFTISMKSIQQLVHTCILNTHKDKRKQKQLGGGGGGI